MKKKPAPEFGTPEDNLEQPRYASKGAKFLPLVGGDNGVTGADGQLFSLPSLFEGSPEQDILPGLGVLLLGAQLGALVEFMVHRRGHFTVMMPRVLKAYAARVAVALGRRHEIWDCAPCEDPRSAWVRAEFWPVKAPG